MDDDFIRKLIDEYGDRSVTISLNDLGLIMGRNIAQVVSLEDLLDDDPDNAAVHAALLGLLMQFCAKLLEDIMDSEELEIEDNNGG